MVPASILIFTNSIDTHAYAVDYVLKLMGHIPHTLNTAYIPQGEELSFSIYDGEPVLSVGSFTGPVANVTASWNRRASKLFALPDTLPAADHNYVRNNTQSILAGVMHLLDSRFPVNPLAAARINSNKLSQLKVASAVGFRVPKTLISNSFSRIKDFVCSVPEACVKPYHMHAWQTEHGPLQSLTVKIDNAMLTDRPSFEIAPHIYQEFIAKRAEYRLTLFGGYSAAVRIDTSRLDGASASDWRATPDYLNCMTPCELPADIIRAARRVLSGLGLRFGSFDIVQDYSGEYVFLEVNEAGQWLWQEIHCENCRILQPFCEFIASADDNYIWDGKVNPKYSASSVCNALDKDPWFSIQNIDEYVDSEVHVSKE